MLKMIYAMMIVAQIPPITAPAIKAPARGITKGNPKALQNKPIDRRKQRYKQTRAEHFREAFLYHADCLI